MINVLGWTLRAPSVVTRLVLVVGMSVGLMIADYKGQHLERIRVGLSIALYPLQVLAAVPAALGSGAVDFFTTKNTLQGSNAKLHEENLALSSKLQQYDALEEENNRLRKMLGSAARVADRALVAELIEVSNEPFTRRILIARGDRDSAYVGQPVIDAHGIVGQITQILGSHSRVTLLTDPGHAIPVLVNRNGLRALVFGTGDPDELRVPYLTSVADIREGDLLVSSGMGGTFPPGYPVATVTKIVNDPNESFLEIHAQPVARLNHSKEVLLVWPGAGKKTEKK